MTKPQLFFPALLLLTPAALLAQGVWNQFPEARMQNFLTAQNGWFFSGSSGANKLEGQSGPVYGRPLTANEVRDTTQTLSDGSHITHSETDKFYRDGQGRMRTETETGAVIYDPVAGFTYDLTFARKTYTKQPIRPDATVTIAAAAHQSSVSSSYSSSTTTSNSSHNSTSSGGLFHATPAGGNSGTTEALPAQLINGVNAKGSRVTITIPAGSIGNDRDLKVINERWYSDDMKLLLKTSNTDPRFGSTTYELQNIVQGEPSNNLFQVPSDFTEGH